MILRPVEESRMLKLLADYARNRSSEATLEDLLAYIYYRGLRISATTLRRKLDRLAEQGLVAITYRQHLLALQSDGKQWFLPVKRRVYVLRLSRLARAVEAWRGR